MGTGPEAILGKQSAQASGIVTRRAETRRPSGTGDVAPGSPVRKPGSLEPGPQGTRKTTLDGTGL